MPADRQEALRALVIFSISMLAVLAVMIVLAHAAGARPSAAYANSAPEIKAWFSNQRNGKGQSCCADSDGFPFFGAYEINAADGSVTLQTEAGPRTLPAYMVLKGPNPTGHAIWWHIGQTDYCFSPGSLS